MKTRKELAVCGVAALVCAVLVGCDSSPPQAKVAQTRAGPIEYTLRGNGPVILKVHGNSQDCEASEGNEALLEAGYSILTPSRPGYGKTPSSVGRTAEEAADALAMLLDELAIGSVNVIAISGGGPTGIHFAARHPERVRKLILEAAVSQDLKELDPERFKSVTAFYGPAYGFWNFMLKAMAIVAPGALSRQTIVLFGTHDPDEAMKALSKADIEAIKTFYLRQKSSWAEGARNDLEHSTGDSVLNSIQAPTLIVHSREDKGVQFAAAEYSHSHIPGSELWEAPSWFHMYWIGTGADEVSAKMIGFLKEV